MNPLSALPHFRELSLQDENAQELLGPLYDFAGEWTNDPKQGWNLIAVPGPLDTEKDPSFFNVGNGFILETIPYIETISFQPISVVLNRGEYRKSTGFGPNHGLNQEIQQVGAMLYKQEIKSAGVCLDPKNPNYGPIKTFFDKRGFAEGTPIHMEQGMLLNLTNLDGYGNQSFQIARMGTIPHGNTMLCLGSAASSQGAPDIPKDGNNPFPTAVDPSRTMPIEYTITYQPPNHTNDSYPFYPDFIPSQPNQTLLNANNGVNFASTTHIALSTKNGTGGLLNIPFVGGGFDGTLINTTQMTVDYWLSKVQSTGELRLQYAQNINLVFPTLLDPSLPINWPHLGLNTLRKKS